MQKPGNLVLAVIVVSLCLLGAGCAQLRSLQTKTLSSFARSTSDTKSTDRVSQPEILPTPSHVTKAPVEKISDSDSVEPNLTPCKAVEPVTNDGIQSAPFPPALTQVNQPGAEQESTETVVPLPLEMTQTPSADTEVVPLPKGEQTPKPPKAHGEIKSAASSLKNTTAEKPSATISGEKAAIALHADSLDVRKALEMISRQANMNILVSPGVAGVVTIDIHDQTVDQALRAIAQLCGLLIRRENGYVFITTPAEMRLIEENDLPLRVYRLNYVKSTDVEKMVKPLLSKKGAFTSSPDSEVGLKSDASRVGDKAKDVQAGGNSLAGGDIVIVQDYENVLKMVDRIIAEIDTQPVQVLIEAVIVQVKLNKGMELGVNFALLDGAGRALGVMGSGAAINAAAGFVPASVLAAGDTGLLKGGPASGFAQVPPGLKFGFVDKSTTGFINALETMGETKILATPRLLVLNKQRAEIHLGKKLGYATSTQTQTSTVETVQFEDVGTQLRLRPFISSDGMIRMEVRPERSSGNIDADGIPQIDASQVTTNVMVPDGNTIVIGGLIESEVQHRWAGVPLLSRLPWIGYLFRETVDDTEKKELIIILTPHIWHPECPGELNYLGRPRALGLDARVSQKPCETNRDGPSLYELTRPTMPCPQDGPPPLELMPTEAQ